MRKRFRADFKAQVVQEVARAQEQYPMVSERPNEISKAHRRVLFLDELPEFGKQGLEVMCSPQEDRIATISRVNGTLPFPASFRLIVTPLNMETTYRLWAYSYASILREAVSPRS